MPCRRHGSYIVEHVALRFLDRAKVWRHLVRLHDHLAEKHNPRTNDLADHTHHTDDGVHLRKIPAVRPKFFPDIGNRIDADNIHSLVCQVEEIVHHLVEHTRVSVVQIPLIRIERSHHIVPQLRKICKVARRRGRKYLRYSLLIFLRDGRIRIEEVAAHVLAVSLARSFRPLMILRRVVHNEVHAQADAFFMTLLRQFRQIIHSAQLRFYLSEICHRISAV